MDVFQPDWIEGSAGAHTVEPMPTEWRFDSPPPDPAPPEAPGTYGWQPYAGIADLKIRAGRLTGRSTTRIPLLHFCRTSGLHDEDPFYEMQVRMRVSSGSRMFAHFVGSEESEFDRAVAQAEEAVWQMTLPVEAGEELRTYVLKSPFAVRSSDIQRIFLKPTDEAGASFEIESVRLVFRREHIAQKPSGVAWEGLSDFYRESVLTRAPESITWPLKLPARPRLELALGILEERPVTFRVSITTKGATSQPLISRTVTRPNHWDELAVDLDEYAGKEVALHLTMEGEAGVTGLWGAPVVRDQLDPHPVAARGKRAAPQGVILVLADTLRSDHLDLYGYSRPTVPELGRVARQGTVFRRAVAQGAWTLVSTASMMTSLYPSTVGVEEFADQVPDSATTLAEVYREAGYATLSLSSVLFTGKYNNQHQGFEALREMPRAGESKTAQELVDRLLPWLELHRRDRFFVFLHVFDPHSPYEPKPPYNTLWANPAWNREHRREKEALKEFITDPIRRVVMMPFEDELVAAGRDPAKFIEREVAWYDGSIRGMDQELGRVLERLAELGLEEKTLVAFTSDHGEEFHDHGQMHHRHSVYGELINVPLVLWYPGVVPAGVSIDETVQLIDLMPTLLELSALPVPSEAQGQSLVALLASQPGWGQQSGARRWQPRPAVSERTPLQAPSFPPLPARESTALIFENWKLIRNLDPVPGVAEFELYDYKEDPLDQVDVAEEHPDVVARLSELMESWRKKAEANRLVDQSAENPEDLAEKELERLRALGYVQ